MSDATLEEIVEEAKKPGVFNIVSVLKERAYPKDVVNIYLDEQAAYDASDVKAQINELDKKEIDAGFILTKEEKAERDSLKSKLDALLEKIDSEKYLFTITGISEGKREELLLDSVEKFPLEYEEVKNPVTGEVLKKELDNQKRNDLFTELLWAEHITHIVAPDGSEQTGITHEDAKQIRNSLPIASTAAITEAIEKIRVATAVFMMNVDEDFLAKS